MPITNFPFRRISQDILGIEDPTERPRPWLNVRIINPDTKKSRPYFGLVDTGADNIAIPADFAEPLGHNLTAGRHKTVGTGSGKTDAYEHTTEIQIMDDEDNLLYQIPNTPIDFMVGLEVVLLGGINFLDNFILTVNYPRQIFQ